MSSAQEIHDKKLNARMYPIYKMISWDLLFYYSIIFLFLTQAKNFSSSQVLFGEACFTAFCFALQIPIGIMVDKIGKKNSLIFANICMTIYTFILIIMQNYDELIIAFFLFAIGTVIKGVCETNILYDSLPQGKKRGGLYSTLDGLGASRYYVVDAVTSVIAGFSYAINPYIPIILCFLGNVIAVILSTKFKEVKTQNENIREKETVVQYFKNLKQIIKFVLNSKRIMSLLIFFGLVSGLIYNLTTLRSSVLDQVQLPEQYFGIVFAFSQIAASIMSKSQNLLNRRFRNHTLAFLAIPLTMSCILIGILANLSNTIISIFIIALLFVMQGGIKGAYNVLIYRYLNNFTTREVRVKLATIRSIIYNLFSIAISVLGASLLHVTEASNTILIVGIITIIAIWLLLRYMKDKVGLKPSQYTADDLKYSNLNGNL